MASGRSTVATGVAVIGHGAVFVGFLQPWVAGQFGARDRLSGLDLARLTDGLLDHGLAGDALMLPVTRVLLFGLPIVAMNALLLIACGRIGLINRSHADRLAMTLAIPVALVAAAALALLLLSGDGGGVIDGPGFGLLLVAAGALLAIGSRAIDRGSLPEPRAVAAPAATAARAVAAPAPAERAVAASASAAAAERAAPEA